MPSTLKILHFTGSALTTAVSVGLLGYAMSVKWAETTMECSRSGTDFYNGTAVVNLALFEGSLIRTFCPLFGASREFAVIPALMGIVETGVTPVVLHAMVLCLLALCLLFSACSILISLYNSVSNPYETYMGPIGVYVCSSLSACLSLLVLIIFVVNVNVTNMVDELIKADAEITSSVDLRNKSTVMWQGYFFVIPYIVLSLGAIASIYAYEHTAYTHRREQQRPTEDAPKEIMMY